MGDSGKYYLVHIPENRCKGFSSERRLGRKRSTYLSWLNLGHYREGLKALIVIGNPVHYLPSIEPELFRGHVNTIFVWHFFPSLRENTLSPSFSPLQKRGKGRG